MHHFQAYPGVLPEADFLLEVDGRGGTHVFKKMLQMVLAAVFTPPYIICLTNSKEGRPRKWAMVGFPTLMD